MPQNDLSHQMAQAVQWVDDHIPTPEWAKFMVRSRSNQHYGYFYEKKPRWDGQAGCFYNPGMRHDHFRTKYSLTFSLRFNIKSGHLRIMESGEAMNYDDYVYQKYVERVQETQDATE